MIPIVSWNLPEVHNQPHYVAGVFMLWVFGISYVLPSLVAL
jgi:hypothetical protein